VRNEAVAETLHEKFQLDPWLSIQLADVIFQAKKNPPAACRACKRLNRAA
jgi:hypothetical protein